MGKKKGYVDRPKKRGRSRGGARTKEKAANICATTMKIEKEARAKNAGIYEELFRTGRATKQKPNGDFFFIGHDETPWHIRKAI